MPEYSLMQMIRTAYHAAAQGETGPVPAEGVGGGLDAAAHIGAAAHQQHGCHVEDDAQAGLREDHGLHKHEQGE